MVTAAVIAGMVVLAWRHYGHDAVYGYAQLSVAYFALLAAPSLPPMLYLRVRAPLITTIKLWTSASTGVHYVMAGMYHPPHAHVVRWSFDVMAGLRMLSLGW